MAAWKAQWIWTPGLRDTKNSFALFRRVFSLPGSAGAKAQIKITAGHFYHVTLNGHLLGRGPDRCYFREKYYHTYDVTRFLRRGRNVLAVRCHYLGQYLGGCIERHAEGPAGLLAQLEVNGRPLLWTDADWLTMADPAYATNTARVSMHRGWREAFSAGKEVPGWDGLSCDERAWARAEVVAKAEGGPWTRLVKKTTPELTAEELPPLNAYLTQNGGNESFDYDGARFYNPLGGAPRATGDFQIWNGTQPRQEILYDFGRVLAGYPRIELADSLGGTIEVFYGDSLDMTHWDTVHLGKGPLVWSPFTARGARYMRLVITGAHHPIAIRSVRWVRTNYPVAWRGSFASSDPRLDAIWQMCALTAETCGMDHLVDCVGREQVLWMMDFRFQAPQHRLHFGDTALVEKCFRQFATLQLDSGFILGYGPSTRPKEELFTRLMPPRDWLGFDFFFVIAVLEHFRYTGDRRFLREFYPVCTRCLEHYRRTEHDGFAAAGGGVRGGAFVEWGYPYTPDTSAIYSFTQALYYGAISALREMADLSGDRSASARAGRRAKALVRRYFDTFLDPETGQVSDYVIAGKRHITGTAQAAAAMLRFLDDIPEKALRHNLDLLATRALPLTQTGVGNALVAEALFRHGRGREAIALIRDYWGAILDAGLPQVPEHYDATCPRGADDRWHPAYSRCHSYASLAGALLQQHVLGAQVEGRRVLLSPSFGDLEHACGTVPTVAGDVRIEWHRREGSVEMRVEAPREVKIDFVPSEEETPVRVEITRCARRETPLAT